MQVSFKYNGNSYINWDLDNPETRSRLQEEGVDLANIEMLKDPGEKRLEEIEAAIAELAFGGETV